MLTCIWIFQEKDEQERLSAVWEICQTILRCMIDNGELYRVGRKGVNIPITEEY